MGLTNRRDPFGAQRAGWFAEGVVPDRVVYVEPFPRRVRAVKGGVTVIDSLGVKLVHETGNLPRYSIPAADVTLTGDTTDVTTPDPHVEGHVRVKWSAVDTWYEEDEEVIVHPRDPYTRIETLRSSRHVRVAAPDGTALADSTSPIGLYETGLPVRWYLPREDVRMDLLERSDTVTYCPYKGHATHWTARLPDGATFADVAWSYDTDVLRDAQAVTGRIAFYEAKVTQTVIPPASAHRDVAADR